MHRDSALNDGLTKTDIQHGGENVDPMAKVTVSSISFPLPRHVPPGPFQLKCRATVLTAYDIEVSIPVQSVPRQMSDPHTLLRSGSPGMHPPSFYNVLLRIIKVTCAQSILHLTVQLYCHCLC
ncbi:unnamed protein product [Allacma fusca]|uniref:Uncharacterized protein n=1 Tax=Allacma fusca TaxID=39272 RepID=A0A8J2KRC6_9HEXA|nr:unnamed protein product [Allacma fusca]